MVRKFVFVFGCLSALIAFVPDTPALAQGKKMVVAAPGIPPIFASVILYVAQKEGFWKKHGIDIEVKAFETGTAAARAVLTGDLEISLSPTPLIIAQISNADANVVAINGFPNPDWILATTDGAKATCKDLAGQSVGVDAIGGARSIALRIMLAGGCQGMKIDEM